MKNFEYFEPKTLQETFELLQEYNGDAPFLAEALI